MNRLIGTHANHNITWNVECIAVQKVLGWRPGEFGPEIVLDPEIEMADGGFGDDFMWCEDCGERIYVDDFTGDESGEWQLV